jgi:hypothetical protein
MGYVQFYGKSYALILTKKWLGSLLIPTMATTNRYKQMSGNLHCMHFSRVVVLKGLGLKSDLGDPGRLVLARGQKMSARFFRDERAFRTVSEGVEVVRVRVLPGLLDRLGPHPGVDVKITVFGDFCNFSAEKMVFCF